MKILTILLLLETLTGGILVTAGGLNFENDFVIQKQNAFLCGLLKADVNVMDLSSKNLDNIENIQYLVVKHNGNYTLLKSVKNLYLKLNNNNLKTLPKGVQSLDLVKLNVKNNKNLILPKWLSEMKRLMYIKKD